MGKTKISLVSLPSQWPIPTIPLNRRGHETIYACQASSFNVSYIHSAPWYGYGYITFFRNLQNRGIPNVRRGHETTYACQASFFNVSYTPPHGTIWGRYGVFNLNTSLGLCRHQCRKLGPPSSQLFPSPVSLFYPSKKIISIKALHYLIEDDRC